MKSPDQLNLCLGRALVAAAWADGKLTSDEREGLFDFIFRLPNMSAATWEALQSDLSRKEPVGEDERGERVRALHAAINDDEDRQSVQTALSELRNSDAGLGRSEISVLHDILQSVEAEDERTLANLGRWISRPLRERTQTLRGFFQQEKKLELDVRGRMVQAMTERLRLAPEEIDERLVSRMALAGALMARVAHVDDVVTLGEIQTIQRTLQETWDLDERWATIMTNVAVTEMSHELDVYGLVRQLFGQTNEAQRIAFLDVLFQVATADGEASESEMNEIRRISQGLLLSHHHFIRAKLKVDGDQRAR